MYCIIFYCIVLCCIALHCIALYCIVLYCILLYCIVLYCVVVEEDDGRGTIIITTITTISTFSSPPGAGNFRFSTFALCLLRDAEKETHKHKVLWEKTDFDMSRNPSDMRSRQLLTMAVDLIMRFCVDPYLQSWLLIKTKAFMNHFKTLLLASGSHQKLIPNVFCIEQTQTYWIRMYRDHISTCSNHALDVLLTFLTSCNLLRRDMLC